MILIKIILAIVALGIFIVLANVVLAIIFALFGAFNK